MEVARPNPYEPGHLVATTVCILSEVIGTGAAIFSDTAACRSSSARSPSKLALSGTADSPLGDRIVSAFLIRSTTLEPRSVSTDALVRIVLSAGIVIWWQLGRAGSNP